ncbi:MAG: gamma-glutamyltransferase [Acidobacteriota bacterium]
MSVELKRWGRADWRLAGIVFVALLVPALAGAATRQPAVVAEHGMVASAHALASQAGIDIMKVGGNAVDAAVAAAFALGVAEPNASGLGGEGMMVIYQARNKTAVAVDYRSTAPATASFASKVPATGHAAVAVPGTVAGLTLALARYGSMPLDRILAPAITLAEEGFTVTPTLAAAVSEHFAEILENEPLAALFCPGGLPIEPGVTLRNPELARSLRALAAGGVDVFYRGELAAAITAEVAAHGGFLSPADLAGYRAIERAPVRGRYRGYELVSAPPPVGGLPVIEILQILDRFSLAKRPLLDPANVHLMAEAMKRGFADYSAFVADPFFVKVPVTDLLSRRYARARAREIDPRSVTPKVLPGSFDNDSSPSTTSLAVADRDGNLVALTQTMSDFFGAKVMVAGTGIILNNEMKNFSARGVNVMAPGKRMRTTIAPTIIIRRGRPFAALGTPGAARITSTMVLLVANLVDYRLGIQEAIEAPRFFARDTEKDLYVEGRFPAATMATLERLGYTFQILRDFDLYFGGAQGIIIDRKTGLRIGGADPRRDGAVIGY